MSGRKCGKISGRIFCCWWSHANIWINDALLHFRWVFSLCLVPSPFRFPIFIPTLSLVLSPLDPLTTVSHHIVSFSYLFYPSLPPHSPHNPFSNTLLYYPQHFFTFSSHRLSRTQSSRWSCLDSFKSSPRILPSSMHIDGTTERNSTSTFSFWNVWRWRDKGTSNTSSGFAVYHESVIVRWVPYLPLFLPLSLRTPTRTPIPCAPTPSPPPSVISH